MDEADSNYLMQDNTQYAFLLMDDRVLVYRGADQPDMSVINPESDVWERIKVVALRSQISVVGLIAFVGPAELSLSKLAYTLLGAEFRWKADSHSRPSRAGSLQFCLREMENLCRRDAGASIHCQRRSAVVPPRPRNGSRGREDIPG